MRRGDADADVDGERRRPLVELSPIDQPDDFDWFRFSIK